MKKIVIGTRGSKLALKQTEIIQKQLEKLYPQLEIEVKVITTKGDKNLNPVPLDSIGKGWFTKEIDQALLEGNIDLAVHSLKDLPETLEEGLVITAIPKREDAREALISKNGETFKDLRKTAVIGTDSTRRASQSLHMRPDLTIKSLRGNVPTRLEKLHSQDYDAIILAVAGLKRLGLEGEITQYFEAEDFIPSPGQGALAVVTKKDNQPLNILLNKLNHQETVIVVKAERAFSDAIGGGCKLPVGAYATCYKNNLTIYGFIGSLDGKYTEKDSLSGGVDEGEKLGHKLAQLLLKWSSPWYSKSNDR